MSSPLRVVVIGAGVSGLAVAYEVAERAERLERPVDLLCLDAGDHPGGHMRTTREEGFQYEWGPTGFLDNAPETLALIRRLGLESEVLPANEAAGQRFLYRGGKLHVLPMSPGAFLKSPIISPLGKLRLAGELFVAKGPPVDDETVHEFASRRIGVEAAETLIDAMVSGIWAGNTQTLSLKATFPKMAELERVYGGLFRAMRAKQKEGGGGPFGPAGKLTSFRLGMQALPNALAAALGDRLRLSTPVRAVSDLGRRGFRVILEEGAPHRLTTAHAWSMTWTSNWRRRWTRSPTRHSRSCTWALSTKRWIPGPGGSASSRHATRGCEASAACGLRTFLRGAPRPAYA